MNEQRIITALKSFLMDEDTDPEKAYLSLNTALFEVIKMMPDDAVLRIINAKAQGYDAIKEMLSLERQDNSRIAALWDKSRGIKQ